MRIIIDAPMESLTTQQQDEVFRLSRTNEVFVKDVNGELWQVLDLDLENHSLEDGKQL